MDLVTLLNKKHPLMMGILNVTPDSFYDGGKYYKLEDALEHASKLIESGVDIIDVGGESTRTGAKTVSEEEELRRVITVIRELAKKKEELLVSIDTYKANVAKLALETGSGMINDVSGLTKDPEMVKVAASANCSIVIMHNKGIPATKPELSNEGFEGSYSLLLKEIYTWLKKQTEFAIANGVKRENIIIDPGIGFGKSAEEDLALIENLHFFKPLGFPVLVGSSRKSFIKKLFGEKNFKAKNKELIKLAIKNGIDIVRVH